MMEMTDETAVCATTTFVPYAERAPQTDDLRELRAELQRLNDEGARRSDRAAAFDRLLNVSCAQGRPIDGLDTRNPNECERFFESVISGVDGHAYWGGPKPQQFIRNDRRTRSPRRWWWVHVHGEITAYEDIVPACGDSNCIAPAHQEKGRELRRIRYTESQVIGTIQVVAMRLGRAPLSNEWDRMRMRPSASVVLYRLNVRSWADAMRRAGLQPTTISGARGLNAETAKQAVLAASEFLGHPVSAQEFRLAEVNAHLKSLNLPVTPGSIRRNIGPTWPDVLRSCDLDPGQGRVLVDVDRSIHAVREATRVLGHEPNYTEFRTPEMKAHLTSLGLPVTQTSIRRAIGPTWNDALANARPRGRARRRNGSQS